MPEEGVGVCLALRVAVGAQEAPRGAAVANPQRAHIVPEEQL